MRTDKVLRRLQRAGQQPDVLNRVARDVGTALASGERDALIEVARALAAHAPEGEDPDARYWMGFAAAMGTMLAAYEAAHEPGDMRAAALRAVSSTAAHNVVVELYDGPLTGAALAMRLGLTPGGISKILKNLRSAGLVRILGGVRPGGKTLPERGARKPHALTPLGIAIARELEFETSSHDRPLRAAVR